MLVSLLPRKYLVMICFYTFGCVYCIGPHDVLPIPQHMLYDNNKEVHVCTCIKTVIIFIEMVTSLCVLY